MASSEKSHVDKITILGRRLSRTTESSTPDFIEENGKVRFLLNAFFEDRVGADVSVDIMWADGQAGKKEQATVLASCAASARVEKHVVKGWAGLRKDKVLGQAKHAVTDAAATPKKTNDRHGDILKIEFLSIALEDSKRNAAAKAHIVAKALADAYNNGGQFFEAPKEEFVAKPLATLNQGLSVAAVNVEKPGAASD